MNNSIVKKIGSFAKNNSAIVIFLFLFVFAALVYDRFFKFDFIVNLFAQNSMIFFLSFGMTFVIITGNIDLSVGSVMALCGIIAAWLCGYNIIVPLIAVSLVGLALGFLNGFLVVKMKIVPFIATLATMIAVRGYIHIITGSKSVPTTEKTELFSLLTKGKIIPSIPNLILWMVIALIIGVIVLKYTRYGRHLYAVGGNIEAARMMSIKVDKIQITAYMISGLMAGLAGLIITSRLSSGQFSAGDGWELDAIAATVIGGTLLSGGKGGMVGTFFGVLILGIIKQIFNLQGNLNTWWQNIATGVILLAVVIIQSRAKKMHKNEA